MDQSVCGSSGICHLTTFCKNGKKFLKDRRVPSKQSQSKSLKIEANAVNDPLTTVKL